MSSRGSAAVELALGVALLVVPAVVAVISFAPWLEARSYVRAAAAEAARAAVLTSGDPTAAGVAAAVAMAAGHDLEDVEVIMCGGSRCALERGGTVEARVRVEVPVVHTPWGPVGGIGVEATHREPVDQYRSLP